MSTQNSNIFSGLEKTFGSLLELFFPSLCVVCGNRLASQEKFVCMDCWLDLPVTNFHLEPENKVAQLFWGRVHIENAASWFRYRKGSNYQQLIHFIKYKGMKELGFECGRRYAHNLIETEKFRETDVIVPVPLHAKKLKQRGFNQSEWVARGMSEVLEKPLNTGNLFRKIHTSTQTRKNRLERWQNVEGIFDVKNPEEFENRHVLVVDDVVTTGATLEACATTLLKISGTKVSIATLAFADI